MSFELNVEYPRDEANQQKVLEGPRFHIQMTSENEPETDTEGDECSH